MITNFMAYPDYWKGHSFFWTIDSHSNPVLPITFEVEQSIDPGGDDTEWVSLSGPLVNQVSWQANWFPEQPRKSRYVYRVTATDSNGEIWHSQGTSLYGDLGRTDYCIARTLMRTEVVAMKTRSGIPMHLYYADPRQGKCTHCADPVTGISNDPDCPYCHGTGYEAGYYGPVKMWGIFTGDNSSVDFKAGQVINIKDPAYFTVKVIGSPIIREKESFFVDLHNNKRYDIHKVVSVVELRRIPVIQHITVKEIPKDDPRYDIGSGDGDGPCPTPP